MDDINKDDPSGIATRASGQREDRLQKLFQEVDPIEIVEAELNGKEPQQIAKMLPRFTIILKERGNPSFGILADSQSKRFWSFRSGFSPHLVETFAGLRFRTGIMTQEMAKAAGSPWWDARFPLGAHIEGQAVAFMRKLRIVEAVLHINGATPCRNNGRGCLFRLPEMLAEGSKLTVYNKNGRSYPFTGIPD